MACPAASRVYCDLEFTHMAEPIKWIIFKNWHLNIPGCKDKPFISMPKTKSIKDQLISFDLIKNPSSAELCGHFQCGHCNSCNQVLEEKSFMHQ